MRELILTGILVAGVVLVTIGQIGILVRAFRTRWWWGVLVLLLPPLSFLFAIVHFPRVRGPLAIIGLGAVLAGGAFGVNALANRFEGFGDRDKMVAVEVEGVTREERHITLTGWDQSDYTVLRHRPDAVVLQMANADVSDQTLEVLRAFKELRELDLNDTGVTDAGLATLATLPALTDLRLRGTKITDEGFREHLLPKAGLRMLDLRQTAVTRETVAEWKKALPGRRALR